MRARYVLSAIFTLTCLFSASQVFAATVSELAEQLKVMSVTYIYPTAPDYWQSPRGGQPMMIPFSGGYATTSFVPLTDADQIKRMAKLIKENGLTVEEFKSLYIRLIQVVQWQHESVKMFRSDSYLQLKGLLEETLKLRAKNLESYSLASILNVYSWLTYTFNKMKMEELSNFGWHNELDFFIRSAYPPVSVHRELSVRVDLETYMAMAKFLLKQTHLTPEYVKSVIAGANEAQGTVKRVIAPLDDNDRAEALEKQQKAVRKFLRNFEKCETMASA